MTYDPFEVGIDELDPDALQSLIENEVSEGYWVEYKSAFQNNRKIAKSVASFANSYGGWYFVGIVAETTQNVATEICGFSLNDVHDPIDKIREIIKSHIDPVPIFYSKLILLDDDRAVLAVNIPERQETPFITRDGRIYRRIADSSDPVPEIDRHAIDRLAENGREVARKFEDFSKDERSFSQSEDGGWISIYLSPYPPIPGRKTNKKLIEESVDELLELSKKPVTIPLLDGDEYGSGNVPFSAARPTSESIILTQNTLTDPVFPKLGVEIFSDGKAKFHIPLQYLPEWTDRSQLLDLSSETARLAISQFWDNAYLVRFFDIERLWSVVAVLLSFYDHWLSKTTAEEHGAANRFRVRFEAEGVWRTVAFLDTDEWGDYVMKYGLPVIDRKSISYPRKYDTDIILDNGDFPVWMWISWMLCMEFGFSEKMIASVIEDARKKANSPPLDAGLQQSRRAVG